MLKILDKYILKGFLPLLLMTFLICWFIVLLQFLWKYVDELVGKGLSLWVVGQTIFYAAMSLVPLSLPLGILLASLMFFGQIGERLELLAMKASGVPLYRIMAPLFATVAILSVGLLYFQNTYMITAQVRMWTLLYSARYAKPELEIPERVFYNGIPGYSIYIGARDKLHLGRMHDIMLYDHKEGNDKTRIIRADSGRLVMDSGQKYLTWRLYKGQSFENLSSPISPSDPKPTAYAKERFAYKEIVIPFDANFNMHDESDMRNRFVGKNLAQLEYAIDTTTMKIDSIRGEAARQLIELNDRQLFSYSLPSRFDTTAYARQERERILAPEAGHRAFSIDSIMRGTLQDSLSVIRTALSQLQQQHSESQSRLFLDKEAFFHYRTNRQEWHRKFTFPAACLVFFFIGAPLGAIIRKGGLGMPIIVSVAFFIIYYIIDTFGHNMINTEKMGVIAGMWISTWVLLPIGIYLTWQATRDSASMNAEAYIAFFRKLLGTAQVRKIEYQEINLVEVDYTQVHRQIQSLQSKIESLRQASWLRKGYSWRRLLPELWIYNDLNELSREVHEELEALIATLSHSQERMEIAKLQDMPVLMAQLSPISLEDKVLYRWAVRIASLVLPLSIAFVWLCSFRRSNMLRSLGQVQSLLVELESSSRNKI